MILLLSKLKQMNLSVYQTDNPNRTGKDWSQLTLAHTVLYRHSRIFAADAKKLKF